MKKCFRFDNFDIEILTKISEEYTIILQYESSRIVK